MLALLIEVLKAAWTFISSRLGQIALAFVIAWMSALFWQGHRTNAWWEQKIAEEKAAERAAYLQEIAEQRQIARDIAAEGTRRLAEEQKLVAGLEAQIQDTEKEDVPQKPIECPISGKKAKVYLRDGSVMGPGDVERVRRFDKAR